MNTELTALVARHIEDVEARERARIVAALRAHAQRLDDEQESDPAEVYGLVKAAQMLEDGTL